MLKFDSLQDIKNTATKLLNIHGLTDKNWVFEFDRAVSRFGCCKIYKKVISISKKIAELNIDYNPEKIHDTILHEIAHALVFEEYGNNVQAHGREWIAMCIKIGADPERCYSSNEVKTVQGKYKYVCKSCGREVFKYRKKRKQFACGICCRTYNNGKFSLDYELEYKGKI